MAENSEPPKDSAQPPVASGTAAEPPKAEETKPQESGDTFFDPKNLSPELQARYQEMQAAFTKKTQEIAGVKDKANAFDVLTAHPEFVKWYYAQGSQPQAEKPKANGDVPPAPQDISDEEILQAVNDPKKFREIIRKMARDEASQTVLPVAKAAEESTSRLIRQQEIMDFAEDHPDFWDLDAKGLIEPVVSRYPQLPIENVYRIAKYPLLNDEVAKKVYAAVQEKKQAVTEKPSGSMSPSTVVKVKSRAEAMGIAYDYAEKGQKPPEFVIEK